MFKSVNEYFKQKTDNLSFIELKSDSIVDINGYKLKSGIPLPLIINELVEEIKEKRAQKKIDTKKIVRGMIYTIGIDYNFKYNNEYIKILYSFNEDIDKYILNLAIDFIKKDKFEDGLVYLRALLKINDKNIKALFNYAFALEKKANAYYKNKNIKEGNIFLHESTNYFEQILDVDEDFSLAYYKLGFHYLNSKQFKKAQIMWEKFIQLDENEDRLEEISLQLNNIEDDVIYEEGYNEVLKGNPSKGLEKLLPLRDEYTDWWNLIFMIGLSYRQLGNYIKAKNEFEKVLAIKPNQADTMNELGLCLAYLGKFEKAIEYFSKAIEIRPNDYEILCNRGMTYIQINEIEKAQKDILKAYDMNTQDEITISCKKKIDEIKNGA